MKGSLLRIPKAGIPSRGNTTKHHRPDSKPQANPISEDVADARSDSPSPSQISTVTDAFSATSSITMAAGAGDLDEIGSNYEAIPLLFEKSIDFSCLSEFPRTSPVEHVGAETVKGKEAITVSAPCFEDIACNGVSSVRQISTELPGDDILPEARIVPVKWSEKDVGVGKLGPVFVRRSNAMEKLFDAIMEVLPPTVQQRKQLGRNWIFFSVWMLAQTILSCLISTVLVFLLLTAMAPEGFRNNFSEFNGPTPT